LLKQFQATYSLEESHAHNENQKQILQPLEYLHFLQMKTSVSWITLQGDAPSSFSL
jgi:hypothetical protein